MSEQSRLMHRLRRKPPIEYEADHEADLLRLPAGFRWAGATRGSASLRCRSLTVFGLRVVRRLITGPTVFSRDRMVAVRAAAVAEIPNTRTSPSAVQLPPRHQTYRPPHFPTKSSAAQQQQRRQSARIQLHQATGERHWHQPLGRASPDGAELRALCDTESVSHSASVEGIYGWVKKLAMRVLAISGIPLFCRWAAVTTS